MRTKDVFVAGGLPTVTYNPRDSYHLEKSLTNYLDGSNKLLAVTGPTKSGKTVLVRKFLPKEKHIWVFGGQIEAEEDFWQAVSSILELPSQESETETTASSQATESELKTGVSIPVLSAGASRAESRGNSTGKANTRTRGYPAKTAVLASLASQEKVLVIDDFHYLEPAIQGAIIRSLKEPIFEGFPAILLAVPHRRYDAIRVEREMTGRIDHLRIEPWEIDELISIPASGLPVLNVIGDEDVSTTLANECFGSPHLMQEFCLRLCLDCGIQETLAAERPLGVPASWSAFFSEVAMDLSRPSFDRLRTGPRQRSDRIPRPFKDGSVEDIYGAILRALAHSANLDGAVTYTELRGKLTELLTSAVPQAHEITRVLEEMVKIAKRDETGVPVMDWDREMESVHITDPYFAFYLKWSVRISGS